ncbi:MAG: radical SAM protein, partial [Desulfurococcaceae archaeon]|nr:radical SAM protein [Desulfurococcaceae archaeon]
MEWLATLLSMRPDAISVWSHSVVRERLSWYYSVMRNEKPAKFQVAKKTPVEGDPFSPDLTLKDLWGLHEKASRVFSDYLAAVKSEELNIEDLEKPRYNYLDVKVAIAYRLMSPCRLCERSCGALRLEGKPGVCLMDKDVIVHSYFHHMGEEAPLVPSGTIFYGGCNFKCAFCQNHDISQVEARSGEKLTPQELATIQAYLRRRGARNINHVGGEPTPHLPFILDSLRYLDVNVPQLWNSNMYMSLDSMSLLEDI